MSSKTSQNKYKEAAKAILSKSRKPLHVATLTDMAIKDGVLETSAKEPAGVMSAALGTDINKNGEESTFYKPEPGYFDLRSSMISKKPVVYILINPSMPDHAMVGKTTLGYVDSVPKQMDQRNLPLPFEFFYAAEVKNATSMLKSIEVAFGHKKARKNRDFYKLPPERIKAMVALGAIKEIKFEDESLDATIEGKDTAEKMPVKKGLKTTNFDSNLKNKSVKRNTKKKRFTPILQNIPPGGILTFTKDESITCEVTDKHSVIFNGQKTPLQQASFSALRMKGYNWKTVRSSVLWKYKGQLLQDLREEEK